MLKKIVTILTICIILLSAYFYFNIGFDEIKYWISGSGTISLSEEKSIPLEDFKGKIILKDSIFYRIHENILEAYGYDGILQARREFESLIDRLFLGRNSYVKTVDNQLYSAFNDEEIMFTLTDKAVLGISENEYSMVASSNLEGTQNYLDIYDLNLVPKTTISFEGERLIDYQQSMHSNGIIITTFNYLGSTVTAHIREVLLEGSYQVWITDLPGELAMFIKLQKDGLYAVTNLNLYKLNSNGKILWQYSGFDKIKDFEIIENQIYILSGGVETELHIISSEGKLKNKITTTDIYNQILPFEKGIILSGRQDIAYLHRDKIDSILYSPELIQHVYVEGDRLRILFQNKLSSYKIKIK